MNEYTVLYTHFNHKSKSIHGGQHCLVMRKEEIHAWLMENERPPQGGATNYTIWLDRKCVDAGSYN